MGKIIFFFAIVFALSFLIQYLLTQLNKRKGHEILRLHSQEDLKKVEVKISESRHSRFSNRGGTLGFLNSISPKPAVARERPFGVNRKPT